MAKITIDPLHNPVFDNTKFFFDSTDNWVDRYSHPLRTVGGQEPSAYTPDAGGLSGKLVFDWVQYTPENFPHEYFPLFQNGEGVWVREVHLITGTGLETFGSNAKIKSDILAVEWSNDHGSTFSQFQLSKVEVPTALQISEFYDQPSFEFLKGNDEITASKGNDSIEGFTGNDTIKALEGNDILKGEAGNDKLDGGSGIDTAVFSGTYKQYQVNLQSGSVVDSVAGRDGTDTLTNIERLQFSDTTISLDVTGTAGQGYRLYKAAFDRAPDAEGLGYWINSFDHGAWLTGVANSFVASPEFQAMYGANSSNDTFVTLLYQHVLHRTPDNQGLAYWNTELNSGHMSRGAVLASFSEAPENVEQTAPLVANGIPFHEWVG